MQGSSDWRIVPRFPSYDVDQFGNVRSRRRRTIKLLKPWCLKGYSYVTLTNDEGIAHRGVHQLVLDAFVGPCPEGMEACHEDGIKTNNGVRNLRWGTHKSNVDDMRRHGSLKLNKGYVNHNPQKLTAAQVRQIRGKWIPHKYSRPKLAREYGVAVSLIQAIIERKIWKHV